MEKTGSVVDTIKISTQRIERIMIDELRPAMNETRNLVQETRWKMDVYAKATRSDTQTNGIGTRKPEPYVEIPCAHISSSYGSEARKPETNVNPVCSILVMGWYGKFMGGDVGDQQEELLGPRDKLKRQINSTTPEQWEEMNCSFGLRLRTALTLFSQGVAKITQAIDKRRVDSQYQQAIELDPTTGDIVIHLWWLPACRTPRPYDFSTNIVVTIEGEAIVAGMPNPIPQSERQFLIKSKL